MPNFAYTAKNKTGFIQKGSLFANDRASATANLTDKGLTPILIKEQSAGAASGGLMSIFKRKPKVKLMDKVVFSRQFATMINAGVPIVQSLNILKEQSESKRLQEVVADVSKRVEGGATLSSSMAEHPDVFSNIYVNMVKAGETGGILDEVLDRLATQQEKDAEIVAKVKGAMTYPAVIFSATIGAFIFLMTVIVPKLAAIFKDMGATLPIYTRILLAISNGLVHYGVYIAITMVIGIVSFVRWMKTPMGHHVVDRALLKMPIFGPIIVKVNIARFARTLGSLLNSGISVIDAINVTASALNNTVFQDGLYHVANEVKNGKSITEPLKSIKAFPPLVSQMISVGEETGQLDSILLKVAGFYEREVDVVVASITSIIEPVLIITLGAMVGFIVISVFGPISNLSSLAN
jgi:type IV pilus assembly protein PilC